MASEQSKSNAYNSTTSDTSFRKTWDRTAYAAKAAERETRDRADAKARYEAKLAGKKYVPRSSTPVDAKDTLSRAERLDVASNVGKTMLVPAGGAIGKRGRGAGFYCKECDLTFKDNLQWVDHLNSKQHLYATGQSGEVKRATLEEVRERLRWLKANKDELERELVDVDLESRLQRRVQEDEQGREEHRKRRAEKRRRAKEEKRKDRQDDEVRGGIIC